MTSSKIEQRAVGARDARAGARGSPGAGGDDAGVGHHRLDDDRRDPAGMRGEGARDRGRGRCTAARWSSRRPPSGTPALPGDRLRRDARAGLDEQAVRVAVVGAGELDDQVATGRRARQAERAHDRLGARRGEAQPLHRRHRGADRLAELDLERVGRAERQAVADRAGIASVDRRMGVAEDRRPPARRCSRCSAARRRPRRTAPSPRSRMSGGRPTARKARTGLLTPPGKRRSARSTRPAVREPVATAGHQSAAQRGSRISSIGRWIPSRIGVSLTVERRLSVRAQRADEVAERDEVVGLVGDDEVLESSPNE